MKRKATRNVCVGLPKRPAPNKERRVKEMKIGMSESTKKHLDASAEPKF